jgi:threonine-phosphate decarboxylase
VFTPSFAEYEDACLMHLHDLRFLPVDQFTQPFNSAPGLVWLGNPNNPDGTVTPINLIKEKLLEYPKTTFVIDEAYSGLCSNFESITEHLNDFKNLIVTKSLTKMFAIPGLRLGYLLASELVVEKLHKYLIPWSVNALAIEAGKFIIDHEQELMPEVPAILKRSQELQAMLGQSELLDVVPSLCNYFLVKLKRGNAASLKEYLLNEHGFLIREASNFRGLDERYFRIAVQDENANFKLYKAIIYWLQHKNNERVV